MKIVDLRSDTVTKPSPQMWEAIKSLDDTKIGDDVEREDPTVNELEDISAKIVGKEAALLVTSGTQGNLVSLLSQTTPGDEIMVEELSHIYGHEVGSAARIGGLMVCTYPSSKGVPNLVELQELIRNKEDIHEPPTTLLCAEDTHNFHGGTIIKPEDLYKMKQFAGKNDLKFHLDGARIFNAAVALNRPVSEFTQHVDSVMFCLSKGLSCPVGSIVAGSYDFIEKARRYRKMLGGGMRQVGVIACFGLVALEPNWIKRLEEDHKTARLLAEGLMNLEFSIKVQQPETNIFWVDFPLEIPMDKLMAQLSKNGIRTFNFGHRIRFVTHYGINQDDIQYCIEKIETILQGFF
ncbi:MAG: threonine aldolase family protein [Candidatus Hodarchaeota archaeon]